MKTKTMLGKLKHLLKSKNQRELVERQESLKHLLKKLRKRRKALEEKLAASQSAAESKRIRDELKVLKAQREKGLAVLKQLKANDSKHGD